MYHLSHKGGILFVSCTLSVKKKVNYPFLDQAFLDGNLYSEKINPLMNVLKGERNYNIFIPHSGRNNGNIHRSVEYYTTPVDWSPGKSVPNCLIVQTIEYQRYNPSILDKALLINRMPESHETSQDKKCRICPWCVSLASPPNEIGPRGKSEFCPFCKLLTSNKRLHETEHSPWYIYTLNDQMQLKNDVNIKNTKNKWVTTAERTRSPFSIILLIARNGKRIANKSDTKPPFMDDGNLKFENTLISGKQFHKDKKQDTSISVNKNNRWTRKEEKLIDLILRKIKKHVDLKEFEKVGKTHISSSIKKSQNNAGDQQPITNFDSISFVDSEHKKEEQEKTYGNEDPPFYESKKKLSKTNVDVSIINTAPKDKMNDQQVESTYSVKMDIKPIPLDELQLKGLSNIDDNNLIGSNLDSYDGPDSFSPYSNKDDIQKGSKVGFSKQRSRAVKRGIKPEQPFLKSSDLEIMKRERSNDELEKNEIPHDENLINYKINLSPKNMGKDRNIISPVKVIPMLESKDKIGKNDKLLQSLLEGSSKKVKIPMKIFMPDSEKGNHEGFKDFTSDFGKDFKDEPEGKHVKIMSTSLPYLPLTNAHAKKLFEQTQLRNTKPELSGFPTYNPTHDKAPLNTSPQSKEDQSITSTKKNLTTMLDPHLEELSFWSKIKHSIMGQIAPLLNLSGFV